MKLVIVESPNKTKTISQFLGSEYKVMASKGHIRDLAISGKQGLGVDIEHGFKPTYKVNPDKVKIVKELKKACKEADDVYLATDPDREGEAIAWHLAEVLGLDIKTAKRLSFNAITKNEVLKAIENPGHINMDLVASQETRRILDRIIGFDLSELMKSKIKTRSAGRVQSVTLRMIVEHQKEIDAFVPKDYYDIKGLFSPVKLEADLYSFNGETFKPYSIDSVEKLEKIKNELPNDFLVKPLVFSKRLNNPKPPFTTSTLQQEAFSRFGYSVKATSSLAQRLFEGVDINGEYKALITYIRTDSTRLAPEFIAAAKEFISNKYGKESLSGIVSSKKISKKDAELIQDGHEAIRPIDLSFTPSMAKEVLDHQLYNLYRLIYARTVASMLKAKVDEVTSVNFEGNNYVFKADASKTTYKGYTLAYEDAGFTLDKNSNSLPEEIINASKNGEKVNLEKLEVTKKTTQAPSKYNEGTVVKLMEEKGIGRPSTYSSTISTLIDRDYVTSEKKVLTPTDSGKLVVSSLVEFFPKLMDYSYTREMEASLEEVKEGGTSKVELLTNFYTSFEKDLNNAKEKMEKVKDVETGEVCPLCGSPLVIKKGRYGSFIACSNYPKCKYIKKEPKEIEYVEGRVCPLCGSKLVYRTSKKGEKFIGCSNFPKCHYIEGLKTTTNNKDEEYQKQIENRKCPKCGGNLEIKHSRFGIFIGCSNYPKCKYMEKIRKEKTKDNENN